MHFKYSCDGYGLSVSPDLSVYLAINPLYHLLYFIRKQMIFWSFLKKHQNNKYKH